ncbi:ATP-dependent RNA helicase, partial [Lacticaseibacillus paracasei subsp. paracasei Lpp126]
MKFKELGLDHDLLKAIAQSGFEEATPIQAETIPLVLAGKDVIGQAQTGTGKTAAFGLPILQNIDKADRSIQALVISPTRELAIQTQEELYRLGQDKKIKVQAVYGGADIRRQIRQLSEHPQIVVGTPGRILDHIGRHTLKLQNLKVLVLDEADEMLDMGFIDDIEKIVEQMPTARQTLLFSATIPASIMRLTNKFMHEPVTVKIKAKELTADTVEQYYVRAKDYEKFDVMTRLFDVQDPDLALIFGRTKRRVDELTRGLKARGYRAEGIHGDLTQQKRMSVLRQFKSGQLDFLVATDVAARGLDISGVTHVYNYDIPQDPDSYVHRIGRTGRAGHKGVSVTFVTPNEIEYLHTIEDLTKKRMLPMKPPTAEEALMGQISSGLETIKAQVEANDTEKYEAMAESLLENYTPLQLVSAYLKAVSPDDASAVPVKITPERPLPHRGRSNHGHGNNRGGYKG